MKKRKRVGLYLWSTIGDTLIALPLINGLKQNNYDVILIGNSHLSSYFEFLKNEGMITDFIIYKSHSIFDWVKNIRDLDLLLFPSWMEYSTIRFIYKNRTFSRIFLFYLLNIKEIDFIEEIPVKSKSHKTRTICNNSLSYITFLEKKFGIPFKEDYLFFPNKVISNGKKAVKSKLTKFEMKGNYAVIYAFTKDQDKNSTTSLFQKILNTALQYKLNVIFVGNNNDFNQYNLHLSYIRKKKNTKILNLCGILNFQELVGLFNESKVVFSIDGGLLHFALASRAKVISFWGPTIPENIVYPTHKYHYPICRYLSYQPYYREKIDVKKKEKAFDIPLNVIERAIKQII